MKDHTIYRDEEAKILACIEDAELREKADDFCRRMAASHSEGQLISVYIEAYIWLDAVENKADMNTITQISRIIEAITARMQAKFTINTPGIFIAA